MSIMHFTQINFKRKYHGVRPHQSPLDFTWKIGVLKIKFWELGFWKLNLKIEILTIEILKIGVLMIKFEKKKLEFWKLFGIRVLKIIWKLNFDH